MLRRIPTAVAVLVLTAACSGEERTGPPEADADVVVASFQFAESELLGELYAQALEEEGVAVRRELALGPRELVLPALRGGLVDVVPEYAGSALVATSAGDATGSVAPPAAPWPSQDAVVEQLRAALSPWDLEVLRPSSAVNQNVVVVPAALASAEQLDDLDDLGPIAPGLVLGGPAECARRPLCLPGLRDTYGLAFDRFVAVEGPAQVAQAIADGVVDVGVVFSTDPVLATGELVALRDVRRLQPPDPVVPVVRAEALGDPRVRRALDRVSAELTTEGLRFLNWRAAHAGGDLAADARGWLRRHGLVER